MTGPHTPRQARPHSSHNSHYSDPSLSSTLTLRASELAVISGTYIAVACTGSARKSPGVTARIPKRISQVTPKERAIHDQAFAATLRHLHDELDRAVADAYGWPWPLSDEEILERVVALNAARANEEAGGLVRWLRPDYQIPRMKEEGGRMKGQGTLSLTDDTAGKPSKERKPRAGASARQSKIPWPKLLAGRVRAVEAALAAEGKPVTADQLATRFSRAKAGDIAEILQTLATLGRARPGDSKGTFIR